MNKYAKSMLRMVAVAAFLAVSAGGAVNAFATDGKPVSVSVNAESSSDGGLLAIEDNWAWD